MSGSDCRELRDLIAWWPVGDLSESERQRADEHLAVCSDCAELASFATAIGEKLREVHSSHPTPEAIVAIAEQGDARCAGERGDFEDHLALCGDCREEIAMLDTIAADLAMADSTERSAGTARRAAGALASRERRRSFGERALGFGAMLLRPAPAAAYLVVAIAAIGIGFFPRSGNDAGPVLPAMNRDLLSGVVIVPDETDRLRAGGAREISAVRIDAASPQVLLLEFTGLSNPPRPREEFLVEILQPGQAEPALSATVLGETFSDNYTLSLFLPAGALALGEHNLRVVRGGGEVIYRSSMTAY